MGASASTSWAGRILAALPFPPESPPERFLRTPWSFVAAVTGSFSFMVFCGALMLFVTDDPEIRRIDSGRGDEVIKQVLQGGSASRTPRDSLLLGHAFARKGQTAAALRHYADAGHGGGADERALDYVLLALDHPFAGAPMDALRSWTGGDVKDRLIELCEAKSWLLRHNALSVLEKRDEANNEVIEMVAILDVSTADMCDDRRDGLHRLETVGAGSDALDAISAMEDNFSLTQNHCMLPTEIERVFKAVESR